MSSRAGRAFSPALRPSGAHTAGTRWAPAGVLLPARAPERRGTAVAGTAAAGLRLRAPPGEGAHSPPGSQRGTQHSPCLSAFAALGECGRRTAACRARPVTALGSQQRLLLGAALSPPSLALPRWLLRCPPVEGCGSEGAQRRYKLPTVFGQKPKGYHWQQVSQFFSLE